MSKEIVLANPRGFCAGVDRAIDIVEKSLEKFDQPVFVRHQVVHNKKVVEDLEKKASNLLKKLKRFLIMQLLFLVLMASVNLLKMKLERENLCILMQLVLWSRKFT